MPGTCSHLEAPQAAPHQVQGCEECRRVGSTWVHLRACLTCGQVGCCDSSPKKHARAHADAVHHPTIRSMERGETWTYCYEDDAYGELA